MSFVCQQCKQPILLDLSLDDVVPDDVPPIPQRRATAPASPSQKLARLNAPPAVKQAWSSAQPTHLSSGSSTPRASKALRDTSPSESFVLLQDSVVHKIPRTPTRSASTSSPSSSSSHRQQALASSPSARPSHKRISTIASSSAAAPSGQSESTPRSSTPPHSNANSLHSSQRLYTILSSRSDLDHPLCADCTNTLLEGLERQLAETKRERDGYIAFEKEVRRMRESGAASGNGSSAGGVEERKLERRIEKLEGEANKAIEDLRAAEQEKLVLEKELAALEQQEKALEEEEADFWSTHALTRLTASHAQQTLSSLTAALAHTHTQLRTLSRTNVYNDAFCIGHDGIFGTINGLRLGRPGSSGVNVEWNEVNAAWGQVVLLTVVIARKLEFVFDGWRLVPLGSFSRIEKLLGATSGGTDKGGAGSYELYGSGDTLTRILHNRRFDYAMVGFLDCLRQLVEHVKSIDNSVDFPHAIVKDRIGEASVKLQFNQEEVWTRAMRHVLLALKLLLKWATSG